MKSLFNSRRYAELLKLCNGKIKTASEWLTPYLFCSAAYVQEGDTTKGKDMLSHYERNKGSAYENDPLCKEVLTYLRKEMPDSTQP